MMTQESVGPAPFPSTMWSEVLSLQKDGDVRRRERLERLIGRYWRPVYWAFRTDGRLTDSEARDLTQDFFLEILEGGVISGVDPAIGSFRRYLKGALRNFVRNERRRHATQKRGGTARLLSLDFSTAGPEPAALGPDPEAALDRAWAVQLLQESMKDVEETFRREGRLRDLDIFRVYDLAPDGDRPSYAELAARFAVTEDDIWTALRYGRRKLREALSARIGPYVNRESDLFEELRELFGG